MARHTSTQASLATIRASPETLLADFTTFGLLFESLCVRDLRVYAQGLDGEVFHYRDKSGLEADAVAQLVDGRWGATEVGYRRPDGVLVVPIGGLGP